MNNFFRGPCYACSEPREGEKGTEGTSEREFGADSLAATGEFWHVLFDCDGASSSGRDWLALRYGGDVER
jgi:hypothetical protein